MAKHLTAAVLTVLVLATPARADWLLTPFLGVTFGGDTPNEQVNYGLSFGFLGGGVFGVEFDASITPNFFDSGNPAVPLEDSNVSTVMGNLMLSNLPVRCAPTIPGGFGLVAHRRDQRRQRLRHQRQQLRLQRRRRNHGPVQRARRRARRPPLFPQRPGFGTSATTSTSTWAASTSGAARSASSSAGSAIPANREEAIWTPLYGNLQVACRPSMAQGRGVASSPAALERPSVDCWVLYITGDQVAMEDTPGRASRRSVERCTAPVRSGCSSRLRHLGAARRRRLGAAPSSAGSSGSTTTPTSPKSASKRRDHAAASRRAGRRRASRRSRRWSSASTAVSSRRGARAPCSRRLTRPSSVRASDPSR